MWGCGVAKFLVDGTRDQDLSEQLGQKIYLVDGQQVKNGTGIGNNQKH
jgi:hypothetical protein